MPGLVNAGEGYAKTALSGFVRESALQEHIDQANMELDAQRKMQQAQETTQLMGAGAAIGFAAGGPPGALIGAGAGFLFGKLF